MYRFFQVCIFCYVLVYMWLFEAAWSYAEVPLGSFNAWGSDNDASTAMREQTFEYCNNASYSFVYWEPGWNYGTPPKCRKLTTNEVTQKGIGSVFFTTVYIEKQTHGWKCTSATDAAERTACTNRAGAVTAHADGQCECVTEEAYFPVAVEQMAMNLNFGYTTSAKFGGSGGSTNVPAGTTDPTTGDQPIEVAVLDQSGTNIIPTYASGETVSLSVSDSGS